MTVFCWSYFCTDPARGQLPFAPRADFVSFAFDRVLSASTSILAFLMPLTGRSVFIQPQTLEKPLQLLFADFSICVSSDLIVSVSVCLPAYLSAYLPVCLPGCLSLSVSLSFSNICLSICLSVCLLVYLPHSLVLLLIRLSITKAQELYRKNNPAEPLAKLTLTGAGLIKQRIPSGVHALPIAHVFFLSPVKRWVAVRARDSLSVNSQQGRVFVVVISRRRKC